MVPLLFAAAKLQLFLKPATIFYKNFGFFLDICSPKQNKMKSFISNRLILTAILVALCGGLFSQANVDSPYSMFGIGQVRNKSMNARLKGMGGVSNAMFDKTLINNENPASYALIDTLAFLFDAGLYAKSSSFSTSSDSETATNVSFDHVAIGFGVTKWWKMALGVQPYTNVGYNVVTSFYDSEVGKYSQLYQGDGGLNQAFWGNAFRLGKHFSVGANVNFTFGDSKSTTTLSFPDTTYVLCSRRSHDLMVRSFMFDYGLMYRANLGGDITLAVGATYDQKIKLRGNQTIFIRSIAANESTSTAGEYLIDTIYYSKDKETRYTMPHGIGFGITLQKSNRWILGADFNWSQWSRFAQEILSESLQDSWSVAIGGEYVPPFTSISGYWTKVSYRLGGFYEQTYLNINGHSINKIGVTVGLSLPIPKSFSKVNLALEFGNCGTKSDNLIQEQYVNLSVGVSILERWFMKRMYK